MYNRLPNHSRIILVFIVLLFAGVPGDSFSSGYLIKQYEGQVFILGEPSDVVIEIHGVVSLELHNISLFNIIGIEGNITVDITSTERNFLVEAKHWNDTFTGITIAGPMSTYYEWNIQNPNSTNMSIEYYQNAEGLYYAVINNIQGMYNIEEVVWHQGWPPLETLSSTPQIETASFYMAIPLSFLMLRICRKKNNG